MSIPFHKRIVVSSQWQHVGDTDVVLIGRDPDNTDTGRVSLVINSGTCTMNVRPTLEELKALRDLLTEALYAEDLIEFAGVAA